MAKENQEGLHSILFRCGEEIMTYPNKDLRWVSGVIYYGDILVSSDPWLIGRCKKERREAYSTFARKIGVPYRNRPRNMEELYPFLNKELGITLANFCKVWNGLVYHNRIKPIEHLIKIVGHKKGWWHKECVVLIEEYQEEFQQAFDDGNKHIMPIMMRGLRDSITINASRSPLTQEEVKFSPQHLKKKYGKSVWKTLCANSYSRNYLFSGLWTKYPTWKIDKEILRLPSSSLIHFTPQNCCSLQFIHWFKDNKTTSWRKVNSDVMLNMSRIYSDTENMATQLNQPFKITWDWEQMQLKHDEYIKEINLIRDREYETVIEKVMSFPSFPLPTGRAIPLNTPALLHKEGQEMGHCVYSYVKKIREGKSIIYGIETEEGRSTLEIREFKVFQHRSKFNRPPPEEHAKIAKEITFNLNEIMKGEDNANI